MTNSQTTASTPAPSPAPEANPAKSDNEIIAAYLDPSRSFPNVAEEFGMSVSELIAWTKRPDIARFLSDYEEAALERTRRMAAVASFQAIIATTQLLYCDKPETARRAAGALIRLAKPAKSAPTAKATANSSETDRAGEAIAPGTTPRTTTDLQPQPQQPSSSQERRVQVPAKSPGSSPTVKASATQTAIREPSDKPRESSALLVAA